MPYFYIIQNIHSKKYYAGSKYSREDCDVSLLLKDNGYCTSSSIVNKIIEKTGITSFIIRKTKVFDNAQQAYNYETRFLKRVDAANNIKFYNCHNNDLKCPSFGTIEYSQLLYDKYGVINANYIPGVADKISQKALSRYSDDNWRKTNWLKGIEKMKNTMSNLDWRKNVAKPRALKAAQTRNQELSNRKCSETKLSSEWKNTIGKVSQEKRNIVRKQKINRPIVIEIKKLCKKHKIKLGSGWSVKDDEFLQNKLAEIKLHYDC
jgi:hypothetical protein